MMSVLYIREGCCRHSTWCKICIRKGLRISDLGLSLISDGLTDTSVSV